MELMDARRRILLNAPHTNTYSGDILRFKTDIEAPLKECIVNFSPMQEGTGDPSPTNIRPISGFDHIYVIRCGKNLLRPFTTKTSSNGITWTPMDDGTLHASGTKTASAIIQRATFLNPGYNVSSPSAGTMTNDFKTGIMLKYGGCWNPSSKKYFDIYPWDITTNARPKKSSTSSDNAVSVYYDSDVGEAYLPANHVFRITVRCNTLNVQYDDYVFHPWAYFDDEEDETFEKPMREELDISFSSIGTVYGGSLNFLTGELIVDKIGFTFDGTERWIKGSSENSTFFRAYYYDDAILSPSAGGVRGCSHFPNADIYSSTSHIGYLAYTSGLASNEGWMNFRPDLSQISTLEQWKNFVAEQYANGTPLQCWFTKKNPTTYQLTPKQILTLKGTNNIWSNANDGIEVKYWTH